MCNVAATSGSFDGFEDLQDLKTVPGGGFAAS
jgi:hypothetical protein